MPSLRLILVVEDDDDARETLRMLLESKGYQVEVAENGRGAIEKALARVPHVALVDVGLPDVDGHVVARAIRQQPEGAQVFLVALTGYSAAADRRLATSAGFDAYLVRPVELSAIERLLDRPPSA